jgi:hypothetical protein
MGRCIIIWNNIQIFFYDIINKQDINKIFNEIFNEIFNKILTL